MTELRRRCSLRNSSRDWRDFRWTWGCDPARPTTSTPAPRSATRRSRRSPAGTTSRPTSPVEPAEQLIASLLARADIYSVVAEMDGRVVGSNFLWETAPVAGVGPITVDPAVQDRAVGRRLMEDVLARARERGLRRRAPGPGRVPQPLAGALRQARLRGARAAGDPAGPGARPRGSGPRRPPGRRGGRRRLRRAAPAGCTASRAGGSCCDAIGQGTATVVERDGRITGYATAVGFFGHAVGEGNEDLKALIGAAPAFPGPGLPPADAQRRAVPLVPGARAARGPADDADEPGPVQRARGRLPALGPVLTAGWCATREGLALTGAGEAAVRAAFADQGVWCRDLGSPLTGLLCELASCRLDRATPIGRRILDWPDRPYARFDALPMRLAGGLHALVRRGRLPALARHYPPHSPPDGEDLRRRSPPPWTRPATSLRPGSTVRPRPTRSRVPLRSWPVCSSSRPGPGCRSSSTSSAPARG